MNFYVTLSRKMKIFHWILVGLIVATLLFIWIQSMLPVAVSVSHSTSVGDTVTSVLPDSSPATGFITKNIRKMAHFFEFGMLGLEISLYVIFFLKRYKTMIPLSLAIGLTVAFIDESVQMLSDRGPSIRDMWIDLFGFITFTLVAHIISLLTKKLKVRKQQNGKDN